MMTAQELFDKVATHLLTQNRASIDEKLDFCKYRLYRDNDPPLSCAVGCLIPDNQYDPEMEGVLIDRLIDDKWITGSILNLFREHRSLLYKLQWIHDKTTTHYWKDELRNLATEYSLKWCL